MSVAIVALISSVVSGGGGAAVVLGLARRKAGEARLGVDALVRLALVAGSIFVLAVALAKVVMPVDR